MIKCNINETVSNVKDFFQHDFWHYMNQGGIHVNQLSSPQMDLAGSTHTNTNGVEKSLISDLSEAEQAIYRAETIAIALNNCSDLDNSKHQTILRSAYINELTDYQIEIKLSFSDYQLRREKKKACVEFAERLEFWCKRRNISDLPLLMSY